MKQDFINLDQFNRDNFKRWEKKMYFLLITLKLVNILTTPSPEEKDDKTLEQAQGRLK